MARSSGASASPAMIARSSASTSPPPPERSGASMLQEEAEHLPRSIRPGRIGIGASLRPAGPGMARSFDRPLLDQHLARGIAADRTGITPPGLALLALGPHRERPARCRGRGSDDL